MFEHKKITGLDDYFKELNARSDKGVYFYRICGFNEQVGEFIKKYYEAARTGGVIIEGRIPNPDNKNLEIHNSEPEKMAAQNERISAANCFGLDI